MLSALDALVRQFDDSPRRMAFTATTRDGWETWRRALHSKLTELSGLDRMARWTFEPELRTGATQDAGSYTRTRVELQTAPGYWTPFWLLVPKSDPPFTPIVALHGHGRGADDVVGLYETDDERNRMDELNYTYGTMAAERGYLVVAPDKRGFGERRDERNTCGTLAISALQLGMSVIGLHTWDNMRIIDWLLARDDVRPGPVGCIGLSGGGGGTMWLAAMDERVGCAVISGHLGNYENGSFGCICNAVPHLLQWADRGEIGGLIAPRPLLVESADRDQCYSRGSTLKAYEVTERVYRAAGVPERIDIDLFAGRHEWSGRKAWDWLERWL